MRVIFVHFELINITLCSKIKFKHKFSSIFHVAYIVKKNMYRLYKKILLSILHENKTILFGFIRCMADEDEQK